MTEKEEIILQIRRVKGLLKYFKSLLKATEEKEKEFNKIDRESS